MHGKSASQKNKKEEMPINLKVMRENAKGERKAKIKDAYAKHIEEKA